MPSLQDLYQIADELRAAALMGLRFSENGYDQERYHQILKASARIVAALEDSSAEQVYEQYQENLFHWSPLVGVECVVRRGDALLLIQRRDNQLWALPGGLVEVGETLAQAAERELWEEAGLRGQAAQLLGLFDLRLWQSRSKMHLCSAMFLLESDAEPAARPFADDEHSPMAETLDLGFFREDALPPLSMGHLQRVPMAFKLVRGDVPAPYFDR